MNALDRIAVAVAAIVQGEVRAVERERDHLRAELARVERHASTQQQDRRRCHAKHERCRAELRRMQGAQVRALRRQREQIVAALRRRQVPEATIASIMLEAGVAS